MSEQRIENKPADSESYWKLCTIVLGLVSLVSLAVHAGGPARAAARTPALASAGESDANHRTQPLLSIGGFLVVDERPVFVIVTEDGRRVGVLPMSADGAGGTP